MRNFLIDGMLSVLLGFVGFNSVALAATHKTHHRHHEKISASKKININTADALQLQSLKGIGPKKAAAIVAYRKQHGRFKSVKDLTALKGIGDKWVAKLVKKNPDRILLK